MTAADARDKRAGFTLMEMLTVLGILALVMVVSLPLLRTSGSGRTFRAEAQQISALLRLARIDAVSGSRETRVTVDLKSRRIDYPARSNAVILPPETVLRVKTARGEILDTDAGFRFMPGGGATGGAIEIERDGNRATIAISWLTGAVAIDYAGRQ
ncbi:GspH/FimT family pseudopilin [Taklimakanibacter lacteus]|uniref:GspH/FimT family pseudopilin n=1 Tax=Taklimakanibacter lacteus TaxID=2268456 RepID=UPI000E65F9D9